MLFFPQLRMAWPSIIKSNMVMNRSLYRQIESLLESP